MSRFRLSALLFAFTMSVTACAARGPAEVVAPALPARPALSTVEFGALVEALSEPSGFFPSDNFVSNETSYLHVLGTVRDLGLSGGAYVGVGPDQNFSYIAAIRPEIVFMIDIRRDNLLQHLLYKAAFEHSPTRVEYLAFMLGRASPDPIAGWDTASVEDIVRYIDSVQPDLGIFERNSSLAAAAASATGLIKSDGDLANLLRIQRAFFQMGLEIRYSNRGRFGFGGYPSWRQLIFEADLDGNRLNYLATRQSYRFLRDLEGRNMVVPVVGDLSGSHAVAAIGQEVRDRDLLVTALYTSNVEQYLFQQNGFGRFAESVAALPYGDDSVIIRSFFRGAHPLNVPGYNSTQLISRIGDFVGTHRTGGYRSYYDVVLLNMIPSGPTIRLDRSGPLTFSPR